MALALRLDSSGHLIQFQAGETLQVDNIDTIGNGDLAIGPSMGALDTLLLGSVSSVVDILGDGEVDGTLTLGDELLMNGNPISGATSITLTGSILGERRTIITPAAIAAQQNDYSPTGWNTAGIVRLDFTGNQTITGFAAPTVGGTQLKYIVNADPGSDVLTIAHESASSTAANRVTGPSGKNILIRPGAALLLMYDATSLRWRVFGMGRHHALAPTTTTNNTIPKWNGTNGDELVTSGLSIDGSNNLSGIAALTLTGAVLGERRTIISPTAIAAQQNNYNPTGWDTAGIIRIDLTGNQTITGFSAPNTGGTQLKYIANVDGGSDILTIAHQSASSSVQNRVACPSGVNLTLRPGSGVLLMYDATSSRWRPMGLSKHVARAPTTAPVDERLVRWDGTGFDQQSSPVGLSDSGAFTGERRNVVTPPNLTAQQNNYNPTGFGTCGLLRIIMNGDQTITGFVAPTSGNNERFLLVNVDTSDVLTLAHENASSTAANRLDLPQGNNLLIRPGESCIVQYDSSSSRWRIAGIARSGIPTLATDEAINYLDGATTRRLIVGSAGGLLTLGQDGGSNQVLTISAEARDTFRIVLDDSGSSTVFEATIAGGIDLFRGLDMNDNLVQRMNYATFNDEGNFGNSGSNPNISFTTLGQKARITLNANATFSFTFPGVGNYILRIIQDGTGSRTVTLPSTARAANGAINLGGGSGAVTVWAIYWDGTNAYISSMPNTGTGAPTVNLV